MEPTPSTVSNTHKAQLFWISVMALVTAGIGFVIRGNVATDLQKVFDNIDKLQSASMVGEALGLPFLGFAMVIAIGSPLLDYIGMGRLLVVSASCFIIGTAMVIFAPQIHGLISVFQMVKAGMFIIGLGWGLVETVVNPLTATLYPEEKTGRLNTLHAWWPGGIIIGGLLGLGLSKLEVAWEIQMAIVMLPAAIFGIWALTQKFPPTERVAAGVPAKEMWGQLAQPLFLLLFCCMFLTASSELAPGEWVNMALTRTVGIKGIALLVYVSALMFCMRHFAGPIAHRLSPIGLLWISCLMASLGLFLLSYANSPVTGFLAATVWGTGVCYMWPTMLASASERFPRGGALLIGLMGTAGTLSVYLVLPQLGKIYDRAKIQQAGGDAAFQALQPGPKMDDILAHAGSYTFRVVAILPAILLVVFGAIWLRDRAKGGYRPEKIVVAAKN